MLTNGIQRRSEGVPLLAAFPLMHLSPPPRVVPPIIYGRAPIEEADKGEQARGGILQSREERLAGHRVVCRPAIEGDDNSIRGALQGHAELGG